MTAPDAPLVVIGVGNVLLRDDGVGVRVVEALESLSQHDRTILPPGTHLVDGGTLGVDLLRTLAGARALLLVDGMDLREPAGTVRVLRGDEITVAGGRSTGGATGGVGEMLALGRLMGWLTGPVAVVGIQVADVVFALGLSPRVEAAVPLAVEAARTTLWALDEETRHAGAARMTMGAGA